MASRDIANMHVFLDLKKKFPDLPDETLRSHLSLYAEDQEKCLNLLQKESEKHYPPLPFPDFRLPENKVNAVRNDYGKHLVCNSNESFPAVNLQPLYMPINNKNVSTTSGRNRVIFSPSKPLNQNISSKSESFSAPVIKNSERPFIYRQNSCSSQTTCQLPNNKNDQFIFQTTKNHIIEAPETRESTTYLSVSGEPEQSRKHAVKLSITPSFPFHQQHINIFNNSVYSAASHSSRLDRHTTSVNFQLQPQSSSQFPIEISSIPTNLGQSCNSKDFCSHVQISVGDEGTTFTAVRLQHPNFSQTAEIRPPSSQVLNSSSSSFPNQRIQLLTSAEKSPSFKHPAPINLDQNQNCFVSKIQPNAQMSAIPTYQTHHDCVLAVKNQQIAQLDSILNELEKQKLICSQLRTEVSRLEEKILHRNASICSPSAEDLQKLRDEIKNMRVEVSCLSMEIDSVNENSSNVKPENDEKNTQNKSFEDDEEKNQWLCKNCTFANHPALDKCEMCELPKNSVSVQSNSSYSPSTQFQLVSSSKPPLQRPVGSIQISVTRKVPASKSVKLKLTHRLSR